VGRARAWLSDIGTSGIPGAMEWALKAAIRDGGSEQRGPDGPDCTQGWEDKGSGPEALALSQGLLLWLLLSVSGVWASRGPLRPLCRPINATLAAENEACPVCITFTTSICAGYCPSMVSCPGQAGGGGVLGV
jgi:hypothetical protein